MALLITVIPIVPSPFKRSQLLAVSTNHITGRVKRNLEIGDDKRMIIVENKRRITNLNRSFG
jgi:hypothetical protein